MLTRHDDPKENLLPRLEMVRDVGRGEWRAKCPCHDDHDPSLTITETSDGKLLVHCFVCKEPNMATKVAHAVGIPVAYLFPPAPAGVLTKTKSKKSRPSSAKRIADYVYRYADGAIAFRVVRWEWMEDGRKKKTFEQQRPNGEGGWISGTKNVTRVIYHLPELLRSPVENTVFVVEGEKKVEALEQWGLTATCNAGGAGKWLAAYSQSFRGRDVVILPDNDSPNPETGVRTGEEHAKTVAKSLQGIAKRVRILALPNLPPKGDICDWIAAGHGKDELLALVDQVKEDASEVAASDRPQIGVVKGENVELPPLSVLREDARTDIANGKRLVQASTETIRYVGAWKKWIIWDGTRWKIDISNEIYRRAHDVINRLWEEGRIIQQDISESQLNAIRCFAKYSANGQGIERMVKRASELKEIQIETTELDCRPLTLNCVNGTVNLETGELSPHDPKQMLTQLCHTTFDPQATCPVWEHFLSSIFGGKSDLVCYIQRLCGYWATGIVREQILPIMHGVGANGKTTFINVILSVLGREYTMKSVPDLLMAKPMNTHPTEKADLYGKRFVVVSETDEGRKLSESVVKELTGAERIRARRMREDFWEFDPTHKLALVTNHKPLVTGNDHGIWRRLRLIAFDQTFWNPDANESGPDHLRQDKRLPEKLAEESSGILTWIVKGAIEFLRQGEEAANEVGEHTKEYRASLDTIGQFIDEMCIVGPGNKIGSSELYRAYKSWAESEGFYAYSQTRFGSAMTDRQFQKVKSNTYWYLGIDIQRVF